MKTSQEVFACHEKSCAPPPAGHGGSSPSRGAIRRGGVSDLEQGAMDRHAAVKRAFLQSQRAAKAASRTSPRLSQDGTTNLPHAGGLGGGSAGRKTAPAKVTHGPTATHSAFRDTEAITQRKGGQGSVTTKHNGRSWEIKVYDANYRQIHHASGRSKTPQGALNRVVKEYQKFA